MKIVKSVKNRQNYKNYKNNIGQVMFPHHSDKMSQIELVLSCFGQLKEE